MIIYKVQVTYFKFHPPPPHPISLLGGVRIGGGGGEGYCMTYADILYVGWVDAGDTMVIL